MIRHRALACGLLLALSASPCFGAQPAASEQRLRHAIDADQPHAIALLERLVNQNSGSLNLPGVKAVGDMVRAELEPLGFDVRWIDMQATGRAGHLVATHKGNGRGAADSSFVAADADVLAGLGAAGSGSHAEGETVDLTSIPRQALRSAALIGRLARTPR